MKYCLQVPPNGVRQDGDGFYLIPLPVSGFIQREDGEKTSAGYIPISIEWDAISEETVVCVGVAAR